jgi:hypothetical protein
MGQMINESDIERTLKDRLNEHGFEVLKLRTPGTAGVMDRMILRPTYAPGPPMFVELKKPGKQLRPLQRAIAQEWRQRGCYVLQPCTSIQDVEQLCEILISEVSKEILDAQDFA